jgi:hypothetical protein
MGQKLTWKYYATDFKIHLMKMCHRLQKYQQGGSQPQLLFQTCLATEICNCMLNLVYLLLTCFDPCEI